MVIRPSRAVLSVYDKRGIVDFARSLAKQGVELIATGGTAKALTDAGLAPVDVATVTAFPEMMSGRVKTLHPRLLGGVLADRDRAEHRKALTEHDIPLIDLVVVNLYPFAHVVQEGAAEQDCIEQIDIGGPTMIRAAAKNHRHVAVVTDPDDYAEVMAAFPQGLDETLRQRLAAHAFAHTAHYDATIADWFSRYDPSPRTRTITGHRVRDLRYGENPHQNATLYRSGGGGVVGATVLQGKALSYNNYNDANAAWGLIQEFEKPAAAIIKHTNPCCAATAPSLAQAFGLALQVNRRSAFGGVVALNRTIDVTTAHQLTEIFLEVILAPDVDERARAVLAQQANLRVLCVSPETPPTKHMIRSISGGFLMQDIDRKISDALAVVTKRAPTAEQTDDLLFAMRICKHTASNAIVLARQGVLHGIGLGQTSRVDAARHACEVVADNPGQLVAASDAFFPFPDSIDVLHQAGVVAIIQPGGSKQDATVIARADEWGTAMVTTGVRHFRH
ncbi:MAG: bifunctional phosphoribosylaminoimidazolecarboxamide formyltransferase/IMP cyclohydrolase [Pseudomonadota bacterium]